MLRQGCKIVSIGCWASRKFARGVVTCPYPWARLPKGFGIRWADTLTPRRTRLYKPSSRGKQYKGNRLIFQSKCNQTSNHVGKKIPNEWLLPRWFFSSPSMSRKTEKVMDFHFARWKNLIWVVLNVNAKINMANVRWSRPIVLNSRLKTILCAEYFRHLANTSTSTYCMWEQIVRMETRIEVLVLNLYVYDNF